MERQKALVAVWDIWRRDKIHFLSDVQTDPLCPTRSPTNTAVCKHPKLVWKQEQKGFHPDEAESRQVDDFSRTQTCDKGTATDQHRVHGGCRFVSVPQESIAALICEMSPPTTKQHAAQHIWRVDFRGSLNSNRWPSGGSQEKFLFSESFSVRISPSPDLQTSKGAVVVVSTALNHQINVLLKW